MFKLFKPRISVEINCINYKGQQTIEDITALVNKIKQEYGSTHTLVFEINIEF